jgi:hypothetical protein
VTEGEDGLVDGSLVYLKEEAVQEVLSKTCCFGGGQCVRGGQSASVDVQKDDLCGDD